MDRWPHIPIGAYYLTLTAFLVAAFFPEYRVWGLNLWAFQPAWVPVGIFVLGVLVPPIILFAFNRRSRLATGEEKTTVENHKYWLPAAVVTILLGLLFYLLRAKTHFLGDGYHALARLASDELLAKPSSAGLILLVHWADSFVSDQPETAALYTFQAMSILSGVVFLIAAACFSRALHERVVDRVLFTLGLASGGFSLLFFGYVEYYSLFILSVMVYTLTGLLVIKGKWNRWVTIAPLSLAVFFHVMGVSLIPSAIYLLAARTRIGEFMSRQNRAVKIAAGIGMAAISVVIFGYFYSNGYTFRLALVPLVQDRFTVEGYTLFSPAHLADFLNLLLLLLPGLLLFIAVFFLAPGKGLLMRREYLYLLVLSGSVLGAIFVVDPKLGMPRDWDLFSFAGLPLVILCFYRLLDNRSRIPGYATIAVLAVVLGFLALLPRAVSQVVPDVGVAHFRNYTALDPGKNMIARRFLVGYYQDIGDSATAAREQRSFVHDYPEWQLHGEALDLQNSGNWAEAIPVLRRVIRMNPMFYSAYANMGSCFLAQQQYDSAVVILEMAVGLNPYSSDFRTRLAGAYFDKGRIAKAEQSLLKAVSIDPGNTDAMIGLVMVYQRMNRTEDWLERATCLYERDAAPLSLLTQLAEHHLSRQDYRRAGEVYQQARAKGLDSVYVGHLIDLYPALEVYLR